MLSIMLIMIIMLSIMLMLGIMLGIILKLSFLGSCRFQGIFYHSFPLPSRNRFPFHHGRFGDHFWRMLVVFGDVFLLLLSAGIENDRDRRGSSRLEREAFFRGRKVMKNKRKRD